MAPWPRPMGSWAAISLPADKMCDAIRSYAPGFIFTTSLSPAVAAGAAASVAYLKDRTTNCVRSIRNWPRCLNCASRGLGLPIIDHGSHIVPVMVGDPVHTKVMSGSSARGSRYLCAADQLPHRAPRDRAFALYPVARTWPAGNRRAGPRDGRFVVPLCAESCRNGGVTPNISYSPLIYATDIERKA